MGGRQLMPVVAVRPATTADEELLLAWANDPDTRAASFHPEPISHADHAAWLRRNLATPTTRLMIGEVDGQAVGQVRLDRLPNGTAEISISIAPDRRGRGLGGRLLANAIATGSADSELAIRRYAARIRVENDASVRLFERAGFELRGVSESQGYPCLIYELSA
jgi:RimJ/RimL family protein N-acetyltransferase